MNQIRLREPLKVQTIQPNKYMKYAKEFGYAAHMLPILINYMVIHHQLGWWMTRNFIEIIENTNNNNNNKGSLIRINYIFSCTWAPTQATTVDALVAKCQR